MKICFVTSNLAPFRIDWLDELAKTQVIEIFYNDNNVRNVNTEYISRRPKIASFQKISLDVFKKIRFFKFSKILNAKYDLLILDGYGFGSQIILIFLLSLLKKEFILSIDGGLLKDNENILKYQLKKKIISSAAYYLSTSESTDEFLKRYGAKLEYIYRHKFTSLYLDDIRKCLTSENEKRNIRTKLNLNQNFTVLAVGKFIFSKGFDTLLNALPLVHSEINVLIIGGKITKEYQAIIDMNKTKNVHFINFCDKKRLDEYYLASNIFILPTRSDVWGLVINEAMSKGLPIITTNKCVAGVSLIENGVNGFIIPTNNPDSIAKKIDFLFENPMICQEMSRINLEKIVEYSYEESTKIDILNFLEIYNKEINKHGKNL